MADNGARHLRIVGEVMDTPVCPDGMKIDEPWDGTQETGRIRRRGYVYPYIYIVQPEDRGPGLAWGVFSQAAARPFHTGVAATIEDARYAAADAAADPNRPR